MKFYQVMSLVLWCCGATLAHAETVEELKANCLQNQNVDLKLSACSALIQSGSENPVNLAASYSNRGNAWRSKGDLQAALSDYSAAINLNPKSANAFFNRANTRAKLQHYAEALADYDAALAIDPDYPNIHGFKGRVHELLGDLEAAAQSYRLVPSRDSGFAEAQQRAAEIEGKLASNASTSADPSQDIAACKDGNDAAACTRLLASSRLDDQSKSKVLILRGRIHLDRDELAEAIADLSASIALNPSEDYAFALRARAHVKTGAREKALADYDQAISLKPEQAGAYAARGSLRHLMGDSAGALADLRKALELDSALPDAGGIRDEIKELEAAVASAAPEQTPAQAESTSGGLLASAVPLINSDIAGDLLAKYPADTGDSCAFLCSAEASCAAWTYNVWNDLCLLKANARTVLLEPSSISGMAHGRQAPPRSTAPIRIDRYRGKAFPLDNTFVGSAPDAAACEQACIRSEQCYAFTYVSGTSNCHLMSITLEYHDEAGAMSGVKRQVD